MKGWRLNSRKNFNILMENLKSIKQWIVYCDERIIAIDRSAIKENNRNKNIDDCFTFTLMTITGKNIWESMHIITTCLSGKKFIIFELFSVEFDMKNIPYQEIFKPFFDFIKEQSVKNDRKIKNAIYKEMGEIREFARGVFD